MQEIFDKGRFHFLSIGLSNDLNKVSCTTTRPSHVNYSSEKLSKEMITSKPSSTMSDGHILKEHTGLKGQKCFWPTDIVFDKTGKAVKQLRSYIESHKIESYIRLNLAQEAKQAFDRTSCITAQETRPKRNSEVNGGSPPYLKPYTETLNKKEFKSSRSSTISHQRDTNNSCKSKKCSQAKKHKKDYIEIDYEVVTVGRKNKKPLAQSDLFVAYLAQKQREGIRQGSNRIFMHTVNTHESQNKAVSHIGKFRTIEQKMTPNTSAQYHTINTASLVQEGSKRKMRAKGQMVRHFLEDYMKERNYDSNNEEDCLVCQN